MQIDISIYFVEEIGDGSWRQQAYCKGKDSDHSVFFTEVRGASSRYLEAKAMCYACRVSDQCVQYAMKNSIRDGIWGGLPYRERLAATNGLRSHKMSTADLTSGYGRHSPILIEKLANVYRVTTDEVRLIIGLPIAKPIKKKHIPSTERKEVDK